jgi:phage terminase small subunit
MSEEEEKKEWKPTRKQSAFMDAYLSGPNKFNATGAAIDAGYSEATAYSIGWELLRKPEIKAEIERRLDEVKMSKAETLGLIADIARGDMGEFLDTESMGFDMNLKSAKERGLTKLIKKVKQKTTIFIAKKESDEDREVHELEIELYSAADALVTMAKHHGLLKDSVEVTGAGGKDLIPEKDKEADARHDRALSSLADAIRESVSSAGAKQTSEVGAAK